MNGLIHQYWPSPVGRRGCEGIEMVMAYRLSSLSFAEKVMRRAICAALYVTVLLSTTPGWAQQPLADFVTRFYEDVLRRDPDPTEAGAWANFLRTSCNPAGFAALAGGFFDSSEFRVTRPLSLNGLVTELYRTFLGRDPEPAGLAAWADLIRQARLAVAGGFIHASEFQSLLPDRGDPTRVTAVVTGFYTSIL